MKVQVLLISTALLFGGCTSSSAADGAATSDYPIASSTTMDLFRDTELGALPSSDALTSCAIVEAGYLAALVGDSGAAGLYARGATAAIDSGSPDYTPLGRNLEDALGSMNEDQVADTLLAQCQIDGFERLAG